MRETILTNVYGNTVYEVEDQQILLISGNTGSGKSICTETLAEEYYHKGYTVIYITDVKDNFEPAFAMFKPDSNWHLNLLRKYGKEPCAMPVKLYHPFTFSIPNKKLPEFNFFTFPIRTLDRHDIAMLLETHDDTQSVKLMLNVISNLPKDYDFYELLFELRKNMKDEDMKEEVNTDAMFGFDVGSRSTRTNVAEIFETFKAFEDNYFLSNSSNKHNLDVKAILNDQKHYHILSTKWIGRWENGLFIKDEKLKYFVIQKFIRSLIDNIDLAQHPICFVIEEIKKLTPTASKSQSYQKFVAEALSKELILIRNKGRYGCVGIMNTQNMFDVNASVRASPNLQFLMRTSDMNDLNQFQKNYGMKTGLTKKIMNLAPSEVIINKPLFWYVEMKVVPPAHGHKEPRSNFIQSYKSAFPDKMHDYEELKKEFKTISKESMKKKDELWHQYVESAKAKKEQKIQAKVRNKEMANELLEQKQETKRLKTENKEQLDKLIWDDIQNKISYRITANKYSVSLAYVQKVVKKFKEKEKN